VAKSAPIKFRQRQDHKARAEQLEPALWFVLCVVRALPWTSSLAAINDDNPEEAAHDGQSLKTDHAELRRRLSSGNVYKRDRRWDEFPRAVERAVLAAHASGEVDFYGSVNAIRLCSRAFNEEDTGLTSFLLRLRSPKYLTPNAARKGKRPPFPNWIKRVAETLMQVLAVENPNEPDALSDRNNWTTPLFNATSNWLVTLGVCDATKAIPERTLYSWYLKDPRTLARVRRRRGRPRRHA